MSDWPVGLSTGCFHHQNILDCLAPIRNGGFNMIEVCSFPAHLDYHNEPTVREAARRIEDLGMEAYSFHAPFADHIDITALNDDDRNRAAEEILRAAEAAAILAVRYLVIHPGPEHSLQPPCVERQQRMENGVAVLNRVADRCEKLGIGLVLENKLPHLFLSGTSEILWIMGALSTVSVGVCLDTGHASLSGDIYRVMYKLSAHLQMIHANDNRGAFDDHLPPGDGNIDWWRVLNELNATGFHGAFILELAGNRETDAILSDARRSRRYLREMSRKIALAVPPSSVSGRLGSS